MQKLRYWHLCPRSCDEVLCRLRIRPLRGNHGLVRLHELHRRTIFFLVVVVLPSLSVGSLLICWREGLRVLQHWPLLRIRGLDGLHRLPESKRNTDRMLCAPEEWLVVSSCAFLLLNKTVFDDICVLTGAIQHERRRLRTVHRVPQRRVYERHGLHHVQFVCGRQGNCNPPRFCGRL
jgi:hypothetical protein